MSLQLFVGADLKADLLVQALGDGQGVILLGETAIGDTPLRYYTYDANSSATHDGENVIKPTPVSGNGRFIKNANPYPSDKRRETYSGSTNSSGNYSVTFATAFSVAPNIQANIVGGSNTNLIKITSISASGFTVNVVNRTDVVGLLPSYGNVNNAAVDVLITEK